MSRPGEKLGWFTLPGWQGDREPAEQIRGLEWLGAEGFSGWAVLDLGCAEGAIARHLVRAWDAYLVHGLTLVDAEVRKAREICAGLPIEIWQCDLRAWDEWRAAHGERLLAGYRTVLALSIAHKMKDPARFIDRASAFAERWLVIRLPRRIHRDARSNRIPIDPVRQLAASFALVAEPETCRGEWMGIFERRRAPASDGPR